MIPTRVSKEVREVGEKLARQISSEVIFSRHHRGNRVADALGRAHKAFVAQLAAELAELEGGKP